MKPTTIVVDGRKMKRIAVTCKCGTRFIEQVPGEVLDGGAVPVLQCPAPGCGQSYVIRAGQLQRVPDLHSLIQPDPVKATDPVDAEMSEQPKPVDRDAWQMPGSKLVN